MARNGNYVTVPGGNTNWAGGVTDSLNKLSKSLLDQGEAELERERLDEEQAYRKRQDRLTNARLDRQEARTEDKLAREQRNRDWIKNFSVDEDALRKHLALSEHGVTEEQWNKYGSEAFRSIIPIHQEDLYGYYGKEYQRATGKALDASVLSPHMSGYSSLKAMQEAENAKAEARQKQLNKGADYALDTYRAVKSNKNKSNTYITKDSRPKTLGWADLLASKYAKGYEEEGIWTNGKLTAKELATRVIDSYKSFNGTENAVTPNEVDKGLKYALDRLTAGNNLGEIEKGILESDATLTEKAMQLANIAIKDTRELAAARNKTNEYRLSQELKAANEQFKLIDVAPDDVKARIYRGVQTKLDKLLGRTRTPPKTAKADLPPPGKDNPGVQGKQGSAAGQYDKLTNEIVAGILPPPKEGKPSTQDVDRLSPQNSDEPKMLFMQDKGNRLPEPTSTPVEVLNNGSSSAAERNIAFDTLMDERFNQVKRGKYQKDAELLSRVNDTLDGDDIGIGADTLFVHDFDAEGRDKSWEEKIHEVNNHPLIFMGNKISKRQALEAAGNPHLQKQLIDKANSTIASLARERLNRRQLVLNAGNQFDRSVVDSVRDLAPFDKDDPSLSDIATARANRDEVVRRKVEVLDTLDDFIHDSQGTKSTRSKSDLLGSIVDLAGESPVMSPYIENPDDHVLQAAAVGLGGLRLGAGTLRDGARKLSENYGKQAWRNGIKMATKEADRREVEVLKRLAEGGSDATKLTPKTGVHKQSPLAGTWRPPKTKKVESNKADNTTKTKGTSSQKKPDTKPSKEVLNKGEKGKAETKKPDTKPTKEQQKQLDEAKETLKEVKEVLKDADKADKPKRKGRDILNPKNYKKGGGTTPQQ